VIVFSVIHLKYFYSDTKYIGLKLEENIKWISWNSWKIHGFIEIVVIIKGALHKNHR
jgi:hypothetical protein